MVKVFNYDNCLEVTSNTYILGKKGEACIIIDLGTTSNEVIDFVKKNFKSVSGILLTHAHFDHYRGVNKFLKEFSNQDIPVYIHEDDLEMLLDTSINKRIFYQDIPDINFEPRCFKTGDKLKFGNLVIDVIHTPFHTKGSVCYLSKEDNALFTGDTLFKGSIGRSDFPNSTPEDIHSSLLKLTKLNELLVVYPGHGPITSIKNELNTNPYIRS